MTLAALGIEAKTEGVDKATDQLDRLAGAAGGAEKATDRLRDASGRFVKSGNDAAGAAGKAADETNRLGKETRTAEGSLAKLSGGIGTVVGKLAAMASAAVSAGAYIKLADSWSDLRSQLGAAIGDMGAASDMMQRMVDIANASYSPLDQTVQVYARNVGVLRDLGKSAAQAADFTESLNHMLVITATKGERAASVQNALSKAMAVGKLQAEGLETILANGGRVAQALADELGTTVSGLRGLASEGKITGRVIADSIIKPLNDVRAVAGEMPATVGDAFTRIGTSLLSLVGNFDQATGASGALASSLIWFADNLPMFAESLVYLGTIILGLAATQIPAMIVSLISSVAAFGAAATATGLMASATTALGTAMAFLGGPIGIVVGAIVAIGAALLVANTRTINYGGASREMNEVLKKVPGYADGAAGGIGRAGGAASSAAGQFDTLTGAIDASTSAMSAWLAERSKIPGILPIENGGILGGALPDGGAIEDFLLEPITVPGGPISGRGSKPPPRAPALLGEPGGVGGVGGGGGGGGTNEAADAIARLKDEYADLQAMIGMTEQQQRIYTETQNLGKLATQGQKDEVARLIPLMDTIRDKTESVKEAMAGMRDGFKSAFVGLITGAKSLKETLTDLLSKFADMLASRAFDAIWGGGKSGDGGIGGVLGGFFDNIFGFANGTNYAPGGMALVGERGPELVNLPRGSRVHTAQESKAMMGGGGTVVQINNYSGAPVREERSRGPDGRETVRVVVGEEIARGSFDGSNRSRYGSTPQKVKR